MVALSRHQPWASGVRSSSRAAGCLDAASVWWMTASNGKRWRRPALWISRSSTSRYVSTGKQLRKPLLYENYSWLNYDLDTSWRLAEGRETERGRTVRTIDHRTRRRGLRATDCYDTGLDPGRNPRLYRPYQARGALRQVPSILPAEDCVGKKARLVHQARGSREPVVFAFQIRLLEIFRGASDEGGLD